MQGRSLDHGSYQDLPRPSILGMMLFCRSRILGPKFAYVLVVLTLYPHPPRFPCNSA